MEKLRIAVIGCGSVSKGHIRSWVKYPDRAEIVALVDIERSFAEERKERFELDGATVYTDWREALETEDVNAVNVLTQGDLHTEIITTAMEAGCHVMTEKPTGWSLEECRKLRWYANEYPELTVGVAYSLRYYPLNIRVRELIRSGAIGRIMFVQATHNHPHDCSDIFDSQRRGGSLSDKSGRYVPGSEMTHATHVFDFARYIAGDVRDVFAFRERMGTFVTMRFENGATGHATAGNASNDGLASPHVLCVQGTEGTIATQREYQEGDAWSSDGYHGYMVRNEQKEPIEVETPDSLHGDDVRTRNFLDAVYEDEPLIAPLEDSVRTSELLHAIKESHDLEIRVPVHQLVKTG